MESKNIEDTSDDDGSEQSLRCFQIFWSFWLVTVTDTYKVHRASSIHSVNTCWGHCRKKKYGERGTECVREKKERGGGEGSHRNQFFFIYSITFPTLECCHNLYLPSVCHVVYLILELSNTHQALECSYECIPDTCIFLYVPDTWIFLYVPDTCNFHTNAQYICPV